MLPRSVGFFACLVLSLLLTAPTQCQAKHPFLTGADLSGLPFQESRGVKYSQDGQAQDLIVLAKRNGWHVIRIRLWVNPDADPRYAVSGLPGVTALGKRIKAAGLQFLLDIHYSDTWADPGHQKKPAAWDALPFPQLVQQVHDYSRDVIAHLRQNHAMPDIVQIGNETRNGLLYGGGLNGAGPQPGGGFWERDKGGIDRAVQLMAAGLAGVKAGAEPLAPPQMMIHVPDGQDTGFVKWYFSMLQTHAQAMQPAISLDFDLIGLSYYPAQPWNKTGYEPWHLAHLAETLRSVAETLHKPVMVVETNWPQAGRPQDIPGAPEFPLTPDGQVQFYTALIRAVRAVPNGLGVGVLAWEPDTLDLQSIFDSKGNALPAARTLGQS